METVFGEWWGFSAVRDMTFNFASFKFKMKMAKWIYVTIPASKTSVRPSVLQNSKQFIFGHLNRNLITKYPGKIIIIHNEMLKTNKWQITVEETSNSYRYERKSSFIIIFELLNWKAVSWYIFKMKIENLELNAEENKKWSCCVE